MINGPVSLIICAVLWSTGGIFIKNIELNGIAIAGIRSFISGSFMLLVTRQRLHFSIRDEKDKLGRHHRHDLPLWNDLVRHQPRRTGRRRLAAPAAQERQRERPRVSTAAT